MFAHQFGMVRALFKHQQCVFKYRNSHDDPVAANEESGQTKRAVAVEKRSVRRVDKSCSEQFSF